MFKLAFFGSFKSIILVNYVLFSSIIYLWNVYYLDVDNNNNGIYQFNQQKCTAKFDSA